MRTRFFTSALLLASSLATGVVCAHHSFAAQFDIKKPLTLTGKVVKIDWVNPHAWIHLAVDDKSGKTETWMVETGSPNILIRRGFKKDAVPIGAVIVVKGYRARNGENKVNGGTLTFPDGRVVDLAGSKPEPARPAPN
jgi:hypothetical protein